MHAPHRDLNREHETTIGYVTIKIHQRSDGKYSFTVENDGDTLTDKRGFSFDWQAADAAMQSVRIAEDILSSRTNKVFLENAASKTKGWLKRQYAWFADHVDSIKVVK